MKTLEVTPRMQIAHDAFSRFVMDGCPNDRIITAGALDDDGCDVRSRFNPSDAVSKDAHGSYVIAPKDRARVGVFVGATASATSHGVTTHHHVEAVRREDGAFVVRIPDLPHDAETVSIPFTILAT